MVIVAPPPRLTPSTFKVVKPGSSNLTTYAPLGNWVKRYTPSSSVTAVRAPPIKLGLVIETVTPGNAPPLLSVARPVMFPVAACAKTFAGSANAIRAMARPKTVLRIRLIDTFTFLH
jgi:hypothetical protein